MIKPAYYNEYDDYPAQHLRNLIAAGHLPPGDVDTRSIEDVKPDDLKPYAQCHFFAGVGVWPAGLRRVGWPDDRPIWTGSCPCQPYSAAGKGAGFADERHLWPAFQWLISQCMPSDIAGEQVASKDADPWIDLVQADLEALGYAVGAVPFPSAGVGAPHIRDRTYWGGRLGRLENALSANAEQLARAWDRTGPAFGAGPFNQFGRPSFVSGLAYADSSGRAPGSQGREALGYGQAAGADSGAGRLAYADGGNASAERQQRGGEQRQQPQDRGRIERLAYDDDDDDDQQRPNREPGGGVINVSSGRNKSAAAVAGLRGDMRPGPTNGYWRDADWLRCRDDKWRPVEPGTFPLAHGVAGRVGRLRAYGNACNLEAVVAFLEALLIH